ncbi:putative NAD-dependent deacetylase sirtuin-7 [Seiridium cardinale]|uniref:NAD-dependent deacetylase sirtuin-7 n=1 Tax=Seiridium cardinale TaxID=138064 RepID=A0ABR2XD11_9PEZI
MADSAPKVAAEELHEDADVVNQKARNLADHTRKSKRFIAFTGAGISTAAAHMFAQCFGANAITEYSPTIFGYLRIEGEDSHFLATGIYAVVKFS